MLTCFRNLSLIDSRNLSLIHSGRSIPRVHTHAFTLAHACSHQHTPCTMPSIILELLAGLLIRAIHLPWESGYVHRSKYCSQTNNQPDTHQSVVVPQLLACMSGPHLTLLPHYWDHQAAISNNITISFYILGAIYYTTLPTRAYSMAYTLSEMIHQHS